MSGKLIVICAPSGTGKSTLLSHLKEDHPDLQWSISCTTRAMRPGEINGKDYHFITVSDFEKQIADKEFIEWAIVHSNYYGSSKKFVDEGLKLGKKMLFDLDVQGVDSMKAIYGKEAHVIFIEPPSIEELEKRLRTRGTDPDHVIKERVSNAQRELKRKNDFDYLVLNDDVNEAYKKLNEIVTCLLNA